MTSYNLKGQEKQITIESLKYASSEERIRSLCKFFDSNVYVNDPEEFNIFISKCSSIAKESKDVKFERYIEFYKRVNPITSTSDVNRNARNILILSLLSEALKDYKLKNDTHFITVCHAYIGHFHFLEQDYAKSIEQLLKADDGFRKVGYNKYPEMSKYLHDMALVFYFFRHYDKVAKLMEVSINIPPYNINFDIQRFNTLGVAYEHLKQYDKARKAFIRTKETAASYSDPLWIAIASRALGRVSVKEGDYDEALIIYNNTLTTSKQLSHYYVREHSEMLLGLAKTHILLNNTAQAEKYLNEVNYKKASASLELLNTFGSDYQEINYLLEFYDVQHRYNYAVKNYKNAYQYADSLYFIKHKLDSLFNGLEIQVAQNRINAQDKQYENDKKEEIISNRNQLLTLAVIVTILIMALALLLFRQNRRITKQNVLINKMLAHKQKLAESKSLFFANASHELRTPLTLILNPLDTLLTEQSLSEDKKKQLLSIARQGGVTLNNLISQILDLSKLDGGNMHLHLKPTAVHDLFGNWTAQFESLKHTNSLQYVIENRIPKDLVAILDREKCRQIVTNLISNAIKFTQKNGEVHVTVKYQENKLNLCVSDTGRGIDTADLPYIFDRYFQANSRDELAQGGMGIGLALCKDYVELMGGTIKVESELGKGSSFYVEFPLEISEEEPIEEYNNLIEPLEPEVIQNGSNKRKPTVLVVEDNYTLQKYLHLLLSEEYEVLLAENGEAALEALQNNDNIQIIISDLMMPVMDGYQLLDTLKTNEKTAGIPVIMLTARAEKDAKLKALTIGVDDYMTKPFSEEELKIRVSNLLRNHDSRKEALEEESSDDLSDIDKEWITNFEEYIKTIYLNQQISIPDIANDFAMSESGLLRRLKRLTGLSPKQYIQEFRLQEALFMLSEKSNNYTVQEVALKMGYKDPRTFSRAFKNRYGKLPSAVISA